MELRHLRYFCAVAEEGHITRAAERLRLAQPALTQQIKALEAELKVPLLRRAGRGIELTEAGVTFWREAEAILERVRDATILAQETARGFTGRLRIGLTETASFAPTVTSLLRRARELWPRVEFNLSQARSLDLVAAVLERKIDLAFIRSPVPNDERLETRSFLSEGFLVVVPNSHPLACRVAVSVSDLANEPLIMTRGRPGGVFLPGLQDVLTQIGAESRIVQQTPEYVSSINLVAAGFGVTVTPAVLRGMRGDAVTYLTLETDPPLRTHVAIVSWRGDTSPSALNFLALSMQTAEA